MSAALGYTEWYWEGRGAVFIVIAVISVIVRIAARGRRGVTGKMTPQQFHQPYPQQQQPQQQQPYQQQPYQPPPPPMPTSPFAGPYTNPAAQQPDPFANGPSDRPRSTPLPNTFGE